MVSTALVLKRASSLVAGDLVKPEATTLDDDGRDVLLEYVEKPRPASEVARLHEGLVTVFETSVHQDSQLALFIDMVRELLPALASAADASLGGALANDKGGAEAKYWTDRLGFLVLESTDASKPVLDNAHRLLLRALCFVDNDQVSERAAILGQYVLNELMCRYFDCANARFGYDKNAQNSSFDQRELLRLEALLLDFARQRTKAFFVTVDRFLVLPRHRLNSLYLLSSFCRQSPPYLFKIHETDLFEHLLLCLENDSSTTIVSLALTILVVLLPNLCHVLSPYVTRLFGIYARILLWDLSGGAIRLNREGEEAETTPTSEQGSTSAEGWQPIDSSFEGTTSTSPDPVPLFTICYGLFPVNLLAFIRAPQLPGQGDILDEELMHSRSEPILRRHTIHPNLVKYTAEQELADTQRFLKHDSSHLVAECLAYDTFLNSMSLPSAVLASSAKSDGLSDSVDSTAMQSRIASPVLLPQDHSRGGSATPQRMNSRPSLHDVLRMHADAQLEPFLLDNATTTTMTTTSASTSMTDKSDTTHSSEERNFAELQRRIVLLQNDLNFEQYVKQQYLQHIGRLLRVHIQDSMVESERQNLYNANKSLKHRSQKLQSLVDQLRNQANVAKIQRQKFEADLLSKLRAFREEKRSLLGEIERLKAKVHDAEVESANAGAALEAHTIEMDRARQALAAKESSYDELLSIKRHLEADRQAMSQRPIAASLNSTGDDALKEAQESFARLERERHMLVQKVGALELELEAGQQEREALQHEMERQLEFAKAREESIREEKRAALAQRKIPESSGHGVHVDTLLIRRTDELEATILRLEAELEAARQRSRSLEDRDSLHPWQSNQSPVPSAPGSPAQSSTSRPKKATATNELRYYGRGGVQNIGRKVVRN